MRKGFSIEVYDQNIVYNCRFNEGVFDNVVIDDLQYFIALEGVILNKKKLLQEYAGKDFNSLMLLLYQKEKQNVFALLEGEFSGFLVDKNSRKVSVFTNVTSTQKVFYYHSPKLFLAETSIKALTEKLKEYNITFSLDITSIYEILALTNVLENKTPIEKIYKINDACFIEINISDHSFFEKKYYEIETVRFNKNLKTALSITDEVFSASVLLEYQKDDELQKEHFSLLSGGLDSRMALLYAHKLNQKPKNVFCFSQSKYLDERISRKIAQEYHLDYQFVKLDGGKFLKNIDRLVSLSEGMVLYTGAIHADYAMGEVEPRNLGLIHSGQIGDGVLGGFNTVPYGQSPKDNKIVVNRYFLPKISGNLQKIMANYEREELFYLRNIAFNRAVLGAQVFQQFSYQTSPFMTKDFMSFAVSLPEEWKYNQHFYLDWVRHYCPEAADFTWERTMMKPNAKWKTKIGDHIYKRSFNIFYNKILGKENKISMYPYQYYFSNDKEIQQFYDQYLSENIHYLDGYKDLKQDILALYHKKNFFSKSNAINVIAIIKYYFS